VRGRLKLATGGGEALEETRVALCRCGQSRNKPFCDNSHLLARFHDPGEVFEGKIGAPVEAGGAVRVTARANGPIRLEGPFTLVSADGRVRIAAGEVALCRCGQSRNKPFCDSTHKTIEFEAPALELETAGGGE
jgi:CDGSH-type Zn-finger protein